MIEERQENECGGRSAGKVEWKNADKCLSFSPLRRKKTPKWRSRSKNPSFQVGLEQRRINRMGDFGRCDGAVHPSSSSSSLPPPVACTSPIARKHFIHCSHFTRPSSSAAFLIHHVPSGRTSNEFQVPSEYPLSLPTQRTEPPQRSPRALTQRRA